MQHWSESTEAVNCALEIRHNQADDSMLGCVEWCYWELKGHRSLH